MKKLLLAISLFAFIQSKAALTIIPIENFTNTTTLGTNWLFLIAVPGVGNLNMTTLQLENFLANDPNFVSFMLANPNYKFNSGGGVIGLSVTNTPSLCWTNLTSYWGTNASFAGSTSYVPSAYINASITITNQSALSNIVYTLPTVCYSLSLGTNITSATVGTNGVLRLTFLYLQGNTYVEDFGSDNRFLSQLANFASNAHGLVLWTNNEFELH